MANKESLEKKKRAFMRASVEMMEQAKQAVEEKYSKYEGIDNTMNDIVEMIDTAKDINLTAARNAGYTEEDLKNTEYNKPNGLEVEKYRRYLEKRGLSDEDMHNRAYGELEGVSAVSSVSTKEKLKKTIRHRFMKSKNNDEMEDINEINPLHRKVEGHGFLKDSPVVKGELEEQQQQENGTEYKETPNLIVEDNPQNLNPVEEHKEIPQINRDSYTFDYSTIPDNVQYDVIPLPSKGECYPSKTGRIPVRYITAADENLIASPNMYANGQLIDALLKRCILDKSFDVDAMCSGDRDAVVLWLRATSYGPEYPISAMNNETGKIYNTTVKLDEFKYVEPKIKGDENGWFLYKPDDSTSIKFKILSKKEIDEVYNDTIGKFVVNSKLKLIKCITEAEEHIYSIEKETGTHDEVLTEAVAYIKDWVGDSKVENTDDLYSNVVTENMIKYTMEINGNRDRDYIRKYVENMRAMDARKYRDFVNENRPGVDLSISIPIPESDGGGSFQTFLVIRDTIFINV